MCLLLSLTALSFLLGCSLSSSGHGSPGGLPPGTAEVVTQHNDNARTGQNTNETILTPSNVNATQFGKLFALPVDGFVYAEPLYVSGLSIAGGTHNVVYAATEGDSVYAFDADVGTLLWHASMIDLAHGATTGETTGNLVADIAPDCTDLVPQAGITSTPVIDLASGTMYLVANSKKHDGTYVYRLHRLNIATGAEVSPGPAVISATVNGTGDGGATVTFDNLYELSRPGLLLLNGQVILGFGSHCDEPPPAPASFHGWLFAYNAGSLQQTAVWLATPNGAAGAIWMSGTGIAADSSGNIFVAIGNGDFDGATNWGDTVVKLALTGNTFSVVDSFTPFDQALDFAHDFDLGGGGVMLLPDQSGGHPHELVAAAKNAKVYLVDRDQMTSSNLHYCSGCSSDPEIVEGFSIGGNINPMYSIPAYWNGRVYMGAAYESLMAFNVDGSGQLSTTPSSVTPPVVPPAQFFNWPGTSASVSSSGVTNGIVWAIDSSMFGVGSIPGNPVGPAVLHAYDATNLGTELWSSSQAANNRDTPGNAVKFTVPTIANGKVFIGTQTEVDVYGLLAGKVAVVSKPRLWFAGMSAVPKEPIWLAALSLIGLTMAGLLILLHVVDLHRRRVASPKIDTLYARGKVL